MEPRRINQTGFVLESLASCGTAAMVLFSSQSMKESFSSQDLDSHELSAYGKQLLVMDSSLSDLILRARRVNRDFCLGNWWGG